eukprot:gene812-30_t
MLERAREYYKHAKELPEVAGGHKQGDKLEGHWKGKWQPVTVVRRTVHGYTIEWDGSDSYSCRYPASLLRAREERKDDSSSDSDMPVPMATPRMCPTVRARRWGPIRKVEGKTQNGSSIHDAVN